MNIYRVILRFIIFASIGRIFSSSYLYDRALYFMPYGNKMVRIVKNDMPNESLKLFVLDST
jgi:hypothetical protein